jgi:hypothetical protein
MLLCVRIGCSLEKLLRSYSCLTKGDTVRFKYLRNTFDMKVVDLKPAVSRYCAFTCSCVVGAWVREEGGGELLLPSTMSWDVRTPRLPSAVYVRLCAAV